MSNKELDNLFKAKLKELEKQPSASAWDKIKAQTETKKAVWPWMKIAATLLLLCTVGAAVWLTSYSPENDNVLADKVEKPVVKPESKSPVTSEDISQPLQKEDPVENEKSSIKQKQPDVEQKKAQIVDNQQLLAQKETTKKEQVLPQANAVENVESLVAETKVATNEQPDATIKKTNASTQQEVEVTGKTIEINLNDFSKTAIAANERKIESKEKKEENGLGKVLTVMKEIKSEAGIGDLRAAKNEILAFNFKKQREDDSK